MVKGYRLTMSCHRHLRGIGDGASPKSGCLSKGLSQIVIRPHRPWPLEGAQGRLAFMDGYSDGARFTGLG